MLSEPGPPPGRTVPRLIGRARELAAIADALADRDCRGVVLIGPAGAGRTRLAEHALAVATDSGFTTASTIATRAAGHITLGALEPLLGAGFGPEPLIALRSARDRLLALAVDAPVLLFVDDAQHLDDASATLLLQLARADENDKLFLLLAVASGEPVPDAITALWKDAGARRVDLAPLSTARTSDLVKELLGGPVAVSALRTLTTLSQGLPLAAAELVDATRHSDALSFRDGAWCLTGEIVLSDRLIDLFELRLARCTKAEREAVALIGVGSPLPLSVAQRVVGIDMLQALEGRALISARAGTEDLVVTHPLYGQVALQSLGELRRRQLLADLAHATDAAVRPSATTQLRVAGWLLAAGADVDREALLAAAATAYRRDDQQAALRFATAAAAAPSAGARHLLGLVRYRLGQARGAEAALADAAELSDLEPDPDRRRTDVALVRSANLLRGLNDAAGALACVCEAAERTSDPELRSELTAHRAALLLQQGLVREALELTEPLLGTPGADRTCLTAACTAGLALVHAGQPDRAAGLAEWALPLHEQVWADELLVSEPAIHTMTVICALAENGRLIEAETRLGAELGAADAAGADGRLGMLLLLGGFVALRRGRVRTARRRWLDAVPIFRERNDRPALRRALAGAATTASLRADAVAARELLTAAEELTERTPVRLGEAWVHEARGWLHVAQGDLRAGRDAFVVGAEESLERGDRAAAAQLLHALGRVGGAAEAADRLDALTESIEAEIQRHRVSHLRALAARDGAALEACAERFAATGADLLAAEAAGEAVRAHQRGGDQRGAARAGRSAADYAACCEGARTPAMTAFPTGERLTEREQEIALLAAEGLPSKEIAERLVLSRRTVDNHLQRVFAKLGISSRADLADALGRGRVG